MAPSEPLLLVIVGPTASGKTSLAVELAERFAGEIISCDSVAVYRGFEIGAAKPSREERARVPHHLLDVAAPAEPFTAGDYMRLARDAARDIAARGRMPILAGGTGLYLRAFLDGLFPGPPRSADLRERLRQRAEEGGGARLHRMLRRLDGAAAETIHANDVPKLVRALEVCLAARRPMTEMWQRGRDPLTGFRVLQLGLDPGRERLYERINQRAARMFDLGLIEETRGLLREHGRVPPLDAQGYRQAVQFLDGELTLEAAVAAAQQGHRNYAKRQMTWFRRQTDTPERPVQWLAGFGDDRGMVARATAAVQEGRLS